MYRQELISAPIFKLHTLQKITQNLIFAFAVVFMTRFSEKRTELVFAYPKISFVDHSDDIIGLQVKGDLEFSENDIVV